MPKFTYKKTAERPSIRGWCRQEDESLIDFSASTFVLKVGQPGTTALLTKSSGITGAAGSGVEPTGTPNVTIAWTAGELATMVSGLTLPLTVPAVLTVTTSGLDRCYDLTLVIQDVPS